MTFNELNRVFDLRTALGAAELQRENLAKATGDSNMFSAEIDLVDWRIDQMKQQLLEVEAAVQDFIRGIDDPQFAVALRLRFIRGLLWKELYDLAGYPSEAAVTSAVYRYFRRQAKEKDDASG